jgi:hypothetical protein
MINKEKVILIVSMFGYPKHGLHDRVDELLSEKEGNISVDVRGWGRHQYFWNDSGAQIMYFTNFSIPDGTDEYDVWSEIWEIQDEDENEEELSQEEYVLKEPKEFIVDGQKYLFIADLHGYHHDSKSPEDERYEP